MAEDFSPLQSPHSLRQVEGNHEEHSAAGKTQHVPP